MVVYRVADCIPLSIVAIGLLYCLGMLWFLTQPRETADLLEFLDEFCRLLGSKNMTKEAVLRHDEPPHQLVVHVRPWRSAGVWEGVEVDADVSAHLMYLFDALQDVGTDAVYTCNVTGAHITATYS